MRKTTSGPFKPFIINYSQLSQLVLKIDLIVFVLVGTALNKVSKYDKVHFHNGTIIFFV